MAKKTSLLKFLNELEKEELIEAIGQLCDKFELVKKYFDVELSGDATRYVQASKKEIDKQLYFSNGNLRSNPKASRLNAIIKDFEKISIYRDDVIDLMVYRIERTIDYARDNRNISEALYSSTMTAMARVLDMIEEEQVTEKFAARTAAFDNRWWRYGYGKDWQPRGYDPDAFDTTY